MAHQETTAITRVLEAACEGDRQAAVDLLPLVYDELRHLARAKMARESPGQTLQPTALVHEAYLRTIAAMPTGWDGRGHFFAAAAEAMRRILVDQARGKARLKRGGGRRREAAELVDFAIEEPSDDVIALDEALKELEELDPRKGRIVNLRYFAGLTIEETAAALDISVGTVEREWRFIRTWLQSELADQ